MSKGIFADIEQLVRMGCIVSFKLSEDRSTFIVRVSEIHEHGYADTDGLVSTQRYFASHKHIRTAFADVLKQRLREAKKVVLGD